MLAQRPQMKPHDAWVLFLDSVTVVPKMDFLHPGFSYLRIAYCFCVIEPHHILSEYSSFTESVEIVSNMDKTDYCLSLSQ